MMTKTKPLQLWAIVDPSGIIMPLTIQGTEKLAWKYVTNARQIIEAPGTGLMLYVAAISPHDGHLAWSPEHSKFSWEGKTQEELIGEGYRAIKVGIKPI